MPKWKVNIFTFYFSSNFNAVFFVQNNHLKGLLWTIKKNLGILFQNGAQIRTFYILGRYIEFSLFIQFWCSLFIELIVLRASIIKLIDFLYLLQFRPKFWNFTYLKGIFNTWIVQKTIGPAYYCVQHIIVSSNLLHVEQNIVSTLGFNILILFIDMLRLYHVSG